MLKAIHSEVSTDRHIKWTWFIVLLILVVVIAAVVVVVQLHFCLTTSFYSSVISKCSEDLYFCSELTEINP